MARIARIRFRVPAIPALFLPLLLPTAASAGWGDDNWGEMIWGAGASQVPAMTVGGVVALAVLVLGLSHRLLASLRRRAKRPPLHF